MMAAVMSRLLRILVHEAPAVALGILFCLFFKGQVLDAYTVPTGSMEPTIHGDSRRGDVVAVDKTWDNRATPQRYDTVVFRRDDDKAAIVKRVAAVGPEWLQIREGDLWAGASADRLAIVRKNLRAHRDLLIPRWDSDTAVDAAEVRKAWDLGPADGPNQFVPGTGFRLGDPATTSADLRALRTVQLQEDRRMGRISGSLAPRYVTLRQPVDNGWIDIDGQHKGRVHPVTDCGLSLWLTPEGDGAALHFVFETRDHLCVIEYPADGEVRLGYDDLPIEDAQPKVRPELVGGLAPPLRAGKPVRVTFAYLDGAFQLQVHDGERDLEPIVMPWDVRALRDERRFRAPGLDNRLHLGVAGARVAVRRILVLRDLHYADKNLHAGRQPEYVPEGYLVLLGDNSSQSQDSRDFGVIPMTALLGRPLAVVSPLRRFKLFSR